MQALSGEGDLTASAPLPSTLSWLMGADLGDHKSEVLIFFLFFLPVLQIIEQLC